MKIILEDELADLLRQQIKEQTVISGPPTPEAPVPQTRSKYTKSVEKYRKAVADPRAKMPGRPAFNSADYGLRTAGPIGKQQDAENQAAVEKFNRDMARAFEEIKSFQPKPSKKCKSDPASRFPPDSPQAMKNVRGDYKAKGVEKELIGGVDSPTGTEGFLGCQRLRDKQGNTFYVNFEYQDPMELFIKKANLFITQDKNGITIPEKVNPDAIIGIRELPEDVRKIFDQALFNYGYDIENVVELYSELRRELQRMILQNEQLLTRALEQVGRERRGSISSGGSVEDRRSFDDPQRAETAKREIRTLVTNGARVADVMPILNDLMRTGYDRDEAKKLATKQAVNNILQQYNITEESFKRLRVGQINIQKLHLVMKAVDQYREQLEKLDVVVGAQGEAKEREKRKLQELLAKMQKAVKLAVAARFFSDLQTRLRNSDAFEIQQIRDLAKVAEAAILQYRLNQLNPQLPAAEQDLSTATAKRKEFEMDLEQLNKPQSEESRKYAMCAVSGLTYTGTKCKSAWPDVVRHACMVMQLADNKKYVVNEFTGACIEPTKLADILSKATKTATGYEQIPEFKQQIDTLGGINHPILIYKRLNQMGLAQGKHYGNYGLPRGGSNRVVQSPAGQAAIEKAKKRVKIYQEGLQAPPDVDTNGQP